MDPQYFLDMYDAADDPWGFATRWYEQRKYALTLAMLPRQRYQRVLEPGCSVGVLTARLAARAETVVATDIVPAALVRARGRLHGPGDSGGSGDSSRVELRRWGLTEAWPEETYDLVVLSEVLYYLEADDLRPVLDAVVEHLEPDGHVVAAHWRPRVPEYPRTGDEVHDLLERHPALEVLASYVDPDVRIAVLARPGTPSVATAGGLRDGGAPPAGPVGSDASG